MPYSLVHDSTFCRIWAFFSVIRICQWKFNTQPSHATHCGSKYVTLLCVHCVFVINSLAHIHTLFAGWAIWNIHAISVSNPFSLSLYFPLSHQTRNKNRMWIGTIEQWVFVNYHFLRFDEKHHIDTVRMVWWLHKTLGFFFRVVLASATITLTIWMSIDVNVTDFFLLQFFFRGVNT